ncbi:hypothetical protein DPMN_025441 [Dreissena polymorpha]|uniref:Uncharacterized protein n=1 Tax=Dreissena polymorpha TaxID=45954 RepID=A0A9D4LRC9_DREPO|nr:hypothetical protein DPMN_025441 [Dreissena polymorpha]
MARQRPTRLVMGPCIVEIDRIVIREVQYQLEVNRWRHEEVIVKGNFGWVWSMWAGHPRIDRIVKKEVQYQLEVNRCRNEDIIVKGNFWWVWPMWAGHPRIEVQYQVEVNRCNFGWVWSMWAGCPRIDHIVIREVQCLFEVNWCRNEEIIVKANFGWAWPMRAGCPRVGNGAMPINRCRNKEVNFQGPSANSVGGDSGQDGRTAEITTISPRFSKSLGIKI